MWKAIVQPTSNTGVGDQIEKNEESKAEIWIKEN